MTERPKLTSAQDLRRQRPPNRERVDAIKRTVELEIALHELRERRGVTQEQVATHLGTSRPNVSRIEREDDVRVSTLLRYVEALGGELVLVARFPDGGSETLLGTGARDVTPRRRARRSSTEQS
jgi:transcriptional regulator with XRE-family HTH domain